MELYIYNCETKEIAVIIKGENNEQCEAIANDQNYDLDLYGWSYVTGGELKETEETETIFA